MLCNIYFLQSNIMSSITSSLIFFLSNKTSTIHNHHIYQRVSYGCANICTEKRHVMDLYQSWGVA